MIRLAKKRTQDFTVWTLKPGHLEEDRPITTFSEKQKDPKFFLANGFINFKVQPCKR